MSSIQNDRGQSPARKPGDRMQHEPKVGDQRPREKRRDTHSRGLLAAGMAGGAILFALVVWIVSEFNGSGGYSPLVYIVAAVVGGGVGSGLLPFVSLASQDGKDAEAVGRRGRADAPVEGAEAVDEGLVPHHANSTR